VIEKRDVLLAVPLCIVCPHCGSGEDIMLDQPRMGKNKAACGDCLKVFGFSLTAIVKTDDSVETDLKVYK
jgi:hypothetical protein